MMIGLLIVLLAGQDATKPLPEPAPFLAEFRKNLHTDNLLLSQYTYTEKETAIELDSKGKAKKTEIKVYEILHAVEPELTYRRLVSRNGVPVKPEELRKRDSEHQKKTADFQRKRKKKTPAELEEVRAKQRREDDKIIDEVFAVYDVRFIARESVDGQSAIRMSFRARPGYKPRSREGRILQHIAGEAWVSETDHELVRIEAEAVDSISIGFGLLAKLQKGARIAAERRRFNDEVWLPARVEMSMNARILLVKGMNRREIVEYSDHRKYNVETILTFPDLQ